MRTNSALSLRFLNVQTRANTPFYWLSALALSIVLLSQHAPGLAQTPSTPPPRTATNNVTRAAADMQHFRESAALYAYLEAHLLAQDGQFPEAAQALIPYAGLINDVSAYRDIAVWGLRANRPDLAGAGAMAWERADPKDVQAWRLVDNLAIGAQRYALITDRLQKRYAKAAPTASDAQFYSERLGVNNAAQLYPALVAGLKAHQSAPQVGLLLGQAAAMAKDLPASNAYYVQAATAKSATDTPSIEAMGRLLRPAPEQAVQAALSWTQVAPRNLDAWRTLTTIYSELGRHNQAIAAAKGGLAVDATDLPLQLILSRQQRLAGLYDIASATLQSIVTQRASIVSANLAMTVGDELADDYQPEAAYTLYQQAQTLYAASVQAAAAKGEADLAPTLPASARAKPLAIRAKAGSAPDLTALLALAGQKFEDESENSQVAAQTLAVLRDLGRFPQALEIAQSLPTATERDYETAITLETMGEFAKSEAIVRRALAEQDKSQPKSPVLLNLLGYGLVDRNRSPADLAEGTAMLEQALQISPASMAIQDSLGWAYFRAGDIARAEPLLVQAHAQRRDPEVAAHLGELYWVTQRKERAYAVWTQALKTDPNHKILNATLKRLDPK